MEPLAGRMDFNLTEVPHGFKDEVERVVNEEIARDRAIFDRVVTRAEPASGSNVLVHSIGLGGFYYSCGALTAAGSGNGSGRKPETKEER